MATQAQLMGNSLHGNEAKTQKYMGMPQHHMGGFQMNANENQQQQM